jgi:hypothetical protein
MGLSHSMTWKQYSFISILPFPSRYIKHLVTKISLNNIVFGHCLDCLSCLAIALLNSESEYGESVKNHPTIVTIRNEEAVTEL